MSNDTLKTNVLQRSLSAQRTIASCVCFFISIIMNGGLVDGKTSGPDWDKPIAIDATRVLGSDALIVRTSDDAKVVTTIVVPRRAKATALLIPVPQNLKKTDISLIDRSAVDHLDTYTAPRLVEIYEEGHPVPTHCKQTPEEYQENLLQKGGRMRVTRTPSVATNPNGDEPQSSARCTTTLSKTLFSTSKLGLTAELIHLSATDATPFLRRKKIKLPIEIQMPITKSGGVHRHFLILRPGRGQHTFNAAVQIRADVLRFGLPISVHSTGMKKARYVTVLALTSGEAMTGTTINTVSVSADHAWRALPQFAADHKDQFYREMVDHLLENRGPAKALMEQVSDDIGYCINCTAAIPSIKQLIALGVDWLPKPVPLGLSLTKTGDKEREYLWQKPVRMARILIRSDKDAPFQPIRLKQTKKPKFGGNRILSRFVVRRPHTGTRYLLPAFSGGEPRYRYLPSGPVDRSFQKEDRYMRCIENKNIKDYWKFAKNHRERVFDSYQILTGVDIPTIRKREPKTFCID